MSQETTWTCDWCGVTTKENTLPYPTGWVRVDPEMIFGHTSGKQHEGMRLFPEGMLVREKEKCTHLESELCGGCAQAIVDAVKIVREGKKAKGR